MRSPQFARLRVSFVAATCIAALLIAVRPADAADKWIEIKTEHFTIRSNDRERDARDLGVQFEQFRTAMQMAFPWAQVQLDRPVEVIAVRGEPNMKALAPQYWEMRGGTRPVSVFINRADAFRILIRLDVSANRDNDDRVNPYHSAYWSYASVVLQASFQRGLPLWLTEGLASVLSNTLIDAKQVQFGRQIPWLAQGAVTGPRIPLVQLINLSQESTYYRSEETRRRFDAQCWGLVQYMFFGSRDRGLKLNQVSKLILAGTPSAAAIQQVYGSLDVLESAVDVYLHQAAYSYVVMEVDLDRSPAKSPVRPLDAAEAAVTQASLHVAMGRATEARALLAEARKSNPTLAAADDAEARLLEHEQKPEEARAAGERAAASGSTNFYTYYLLASLSQQAAFNDPGTAKIVAGHAERAIALNPQYDRALGVLANAYLAMREPDRAFDAAQRAIALRPGLIFYRVLAGRALVQSGKAEEAASLAKDALPFTTSPQDRAALQQIVDIAARQTR